ncbi:hypothetical protein RUM44_008942 [Polyplax serrata]|uniref:Battenin n=1 Tax=Polyplax serrata TaxID=468196 RepID=A0ABR1ARC9_POLSC
MAEKEPDENEEKETIQGSSSKSFHLARIVTAFWLLGLCNNYIYVIMLSAAHDIIHRVESRPDDLNSTLSPSQSFLGDTGRNCTKLTTGAILLADIIPTLLVKFICSFLPFYVHFRILLAVTTGILSLVLVATSESVLMAIVGVCFASFNSGLGEITLLSYSTNFVLHAVAAWSSGTGGAGLVGAFAYAGMTEGGLTPEQALYISIAVPLLMSISFWGILKQPEGFNHICATDPNEGGQSVTLTGICDGLLDKLRFITKLLPYMIPVGLVYYFEYLINSGLFDKLNFQNSSMTKESQFRWFNVMYQVGVFVSRSSVTWVHFEKIWIMAVLQGINFVVFLLEAIYGFIPNVWFMFALTFWEGLLGGAAYVNTFYNMSYKIDKEQRLFALSIGSIADTVGIVLSGVTTFPLHEFICGLPFQPVFRWP